MIKKLLALLSVFALTAGPTFADWKLSQKTVMPGGQGGMITTIYVKGVRKRSEMKMDIDPETAKMMEQMSGMGMNPMANMPAMPTTITMCDQKQDVYLNVPNKNFFVDYYDWSSIPPEKLAKRKAPLKVTVKGTMTTDSWVEDSGKRQTMFGLQAKWLKWTMTMETSADACEKSPPTKMEMEGWFVSLSLESESCPTNRPEPSGTVCRPKVIAKRAANPGYMLTGTTKFYTNGKFNGESKIETVDLSKSTLDQALFEIPTGYNEVESYEALSKRSVNIDTTARTVFTDGSKAQKTIAIDFFSGNANKVDQNDLRNYISAKVSAAGSSGLLVSSSSDISGGKFANVIGVEIKKVKESGASKVGGLFGKITGNADAAKAGSSSAEIIVTLYGADGKTVVSSSPASAEVKGSPNDAVKAAIDQVISAILAKAK